MSKYFSQRDEKNLIKLEKILHDDLPEFCEEFFVGIESTTTTLTRLNYAYDLRTFFKFLTTKIRRFEGKSTCEITLEALENLEAFEIEKYLAYLSNYKDEYSGATIQNEAAGKRRKLSALRAVIKYYQKKEVISRDPTISVDAPKLRQKEIVRLESDEVGKLLDVVETGEGLTNKQIKYQENTQVRDLAMVGLLLGTGIRVSELVGIDVDDVDFDNMSFVVTRKGGARVILYLSDEVAGMLYDYYYLRMGNNKCAKDETALFLSLQNKRISTRAVENVVKKYSKITTPLKKITPHKLRSTFGTELYRNTGDIYIVADVLGHKDVNTTKKHYAAISEDLRKKAVDKVSLRTNDETDEE
jgi:site-specific recombinase XerD